VVPPILPQCIPRGAVWQMMRSRSLPYPPLPHLQDLKATPTRCAIRGHGPASLETSTAPSPSSPQAPSVYANIVQSPPPRHLQSPPLRVYSHRQVGARAASHSAPTVASPVTPQGVSFISSMSKKVSKGATHPPLVPKHRLKTMPMGITPRHSRRLAGIEAEQHHHHPLAARS
jgi:hypothetical protein